MASCTVMTMLAGSCTRVARSKVSGHRWHHQCNMKEKPTSPKFFLASRKKRVIMHEGMHACAEMFVQIVRHTHTYFAASPL